jgi:hypothetical protein
MERRVGDRHASLPGECVAVFLLRAGSLREDHVKVGVPAGSPLEALLATVVLRVRDRRYRRIAQAETRDLNANGVPDVVQQPDDDAPTGSDRCQLGSTTSRTTAADLGRRVSTACQTPPPSRSTS